MAIYNDNFNRADGPLSSPWQAVVNGGLTIVSNEVKSTGGGGNRISALTGETFNNDQTATVTISTLNSYDFAGVAVRMDATGNGYIALGEFGDGRLTLYRLDAGVATQLKFESTTFIATDTIGLSVTGDSLQLQKNGVAVGTSFTDATFSSGVPGLVYSLQDSNLTAIDDFVADGLVATASTTLDAPLVYGSAFSGSYSGFTGVPSNTATISDGTGSDLSVAVTINDNGDGTGTFTGTMPSLPAAGQNITGVSLGNVTFGLADPGA